MKGQKLREWGVTGAEFIHNLNPAILEYQIRTGEGRTLDTSQHLPEI
jgi:hypothetical protein